MIGHHKLVFQSAYISIMYVQVYTDLIIRYSSLVKQELLVDSLLFTWVVYNSCTSIEFI